MIPIFGLLREKGIQYGIAVSALWHIFWIFVIIIDVSNPAKSARRDLQINFMGPVLTDDAFNLIVSSRPEFSLSEYQTPKSFEQALEPKGVAMQRYIPDGLMSVSLGRSTWRDLMASALLDKPDADADMYTKFEIPIARTPFPISGELASRNLRYFPPVPEKQDGYKASSLAGGLEFELTVNADGQVSDIKRLSTSGNPVTDAFWLRYLRKWRFAPKAGFGIDLERGAVFIPTSDMDCGTSCYDNS